MNYSLTESKLTPIQIIIAELELGFDHFKNRVGRAIGHELNKIESQQLRANYLKLCSVNQLVFISTKIKPFRLENHPNIYNVCGGCFIRFVLKIKQHLGFWPKQLYINHIYRLWAYATKVARQLDTPLIIKGVKLQKEIKFQDAWNKCASPQALKSYMKGLVTTGKTKGENMSPWSNFDAQAIATQNNRIFKDELAGIKTKLKNGLLTNAESKLLIGAAHKAHKTRIHLLKKNEAAYISNIKNNFDKVFGAQLRRQHNNSAVRVQVNAAGREPQSDAVPRLAPMVMLQLKERIV